jgi:hypothetical protein
MKLKKGKHKSGKFANGLNLKTKNQIRTQSVIIN